jgi:hypothetical protein
MPFPDDEGTDHEEGSADGTVSTCVTCAIAATTIFLGERGRDGRELDIT